VKFSAANQMCNCKAPLPDASETVKEMLRNREAMQR
jgi:hypothetical protein